MKVNPTKELILLLAEMYIEDETGIKVTLKEKDLHTIYQIDYQDKDNDDIFSELYAEVGNRIFELPKYIEFSPTFNDTIKEVGENRAGVKYIPKIHIRRDLKDN